MIAPQVSFANVTQIVSVIPAAAAQREVAPARDAERAKTGSDFATDVQLKKEPDASEKKEAAAEKVEAKEARVERQLADLGGTRLAILHDEDAERFVYQTVDAISKEVERQYPTEQDLERISRFHAQAGQVFDESL